MDGIEQLLSNDRESSDPSRIDREAAAGTVTTDPETMEFVEQAEHWSRVSEGAFDMTVSLLMKPWGFYRHEGRIPPDGELAALRSAGGSTIYAIFVDPPNKSFAALAKYAPEARARVVSVTVQDAHCAAYRWTAPIAASRCSLAATRTERLP